MIKVTIDRAKWDRGEGSEGELLVYNVQGKAGCRCALGFVALACGIADEKIAGIGDPSDHIDVEEHGWPSSIIVCETETDYEGEDEVHAHLTDVGSDIINTNDSGACDDTDRERRLIELGVKAGIEFVFTGEGKP